MNATKTMAKKHGTKAAFLTSLLSLFLCVTMLIGTTLAWFTDSVTSGENQIIAGNLDVEVYYKTYDGNGTLPENWTKMDNTTTTLFSKGLWEPGHTEVVYLKIVNLGTLAFNYALDVTPVSESGGTNVDGDAFKLSDYIKFGTVVEATENAITFSDRAAAQAAVATTSKGLDQTALHQTGVLYAKGDTTHQDADIAYASLVVYMPEDVGNEANYKTDTTPPQITLGVKVYAYQEDYEKDSFGSDYDKWDDTVNTVYNNTSSWSGSSEKTTVNTNGETTLKIEVAGTTKASLTVPANTSVNNEALSSTDQLQLVVEPTNEGNITVEDTQGSTGYDVSLLKIVETTDGATTTEVSFSNTVMTVELDIGQVNLQKFYHENAELAPVTDKSSLAENKYYYDQSTGIVTFMTSSFSPFTAVYEFGGGIGTKESPYLIETKAQMQHITAMYDDGYKYYKIADGVTTMDCSDWTPIRLNGSFDGNNVKLSNIDQKLFYYVGKMPASKEESSVLSNWDTKEVTLENFEANFNLEGDLDMAAGMIYQINGNNTTTIENVTISGKMTGGSNSGAFFTYTGPNYYDTTVDGMKQKVDIKNCSVTANLTGTSGTFGVIAGYPKYCNPDTVITCDKTLDELYTGTARTTTGYVQNTCWDSSAKKACSKLTNVAPTFTSDDGYYANWATDATRMEVYIAAQLDETDTDGNKTNVVGITMALKHLNTINKSASEANANVLSAVTSIELNNKQSAYDATLNNGVLTASTGGSCNFTCGTIKLTVSQYDANGNMVACGTKRIAYKAAANENWTINP